jgi:hypothetical protein
MTRAKHELMTGFGMRPNADAHESVYVGGHTNAIWMNWYFDEPPPEMYYGTVAVGSQTQNMNVPTVVFEAGGVVSRSNMMLMGVG